MIRTRTNTDERQKNNALDLDDKTREQRAIDAQEEMMDYLKQMI
jgi:hypothetical protein